MIPVSVKKAFLCADMCSYGLLVVATCGRVRCACVYMFNCCLIARNLLVCAMMFGASGHVSIPFDTC